MKSVAETYKKRIFLHISIKKKDDDETERIQVEVENL